MGQAGSVEQKNVLKDVLSINPEGVKNEKEEILQLLQRFCLLFPLEVCLMLI